MRGQGNVARMEGLLDEFKQSRETWQEHQISDADGFNLFETMGVSWKEACHSNLLAWLLDHRIGRYGTHAQGSLGFLCFLQVLGRELGLRESYAKDEAYFVRREHAGAESRIDIEVACRRRFIIHLENKIGAEEGQEQLRREWEDLQSRRIELDVLPENCHAIYLTLDATVPSFPAFKALAWCQVAEVFEEFGRRACAAHVGLFAKHYAALRRLAFVPLDRKVVANVEGAFQ